MDIDSLSLSELTGNIKKTIQNQFGLPIWVIAEISEMNVNRTGHCYLELIEKELNNDKVLAKCRATIWSFAYRMIQPYFETTTGQPLRAGLKVLVKVTVEYHEVYGFSLNITDIDPQYTVGEIALKRAKVIQKLNDDGVFDMNRMQKLALVPQRIAIISSETAAGFDDFSNELTHNSFGFDFYMQLFPAIMQGDQAPNSILQAFEQIYVSIENFDAVALIRGGGSKSDLSCFDDYELAYYITQFPLPVLTGIGHERDDSVVDLVAHTRLKTPTALAGFLITKATEFSDILENSLSYIDQLFQQQIQNKSLELDNYSKHLQHLFMDNWLKNHQQLVYMKAELQHGILRFHDSQLNKLEKASYLLQFLASKGIENQNIRCNQQQKRLLKSCDSFLKENEKKVAYLSEKIEWINPQNILNLGYSIVTKNDQIVFSNDQVAIGDELITSTKKGQFSSNVTHIIKEK